MVLLLQGQSNMHLATHFSTIRLRIMRGILPFLFGIIVAGTFVVPSLTVADSDKNEEIYRQLGLFGDIFQRVRESYVDEVNETDLVEAAINGMLTSLDPHSSFLNTENFSDMQVQTRGNLVDLALK